MKVSHIKEFLWNRDDSILGLSLPYRWVQSAEYAGQMADAHRTCVGIPAAAATRTATAKTQLVSDPLSLDS